MRVSLVIISICILFCQTLFWLSSVFQNTGNFSNNFCLHIAGSPCITIFYSMTIQTYKGDEWRDLWPGLKVMVMAAPFAVTWWTFRHLIVHLPYNWLQGCCNCPTHLSLLPSVTHQGHRCMHSCRSIGNTGLHPIPPHQSQEVLAGYRAQQCM